MKTFTVKQTLLYQNTDCQHGSTSGYMSFEEAVSQARLVHGYDIPDEAFGNGKQDFVMYRNYSGMVEIFMWEEGESLIADPYLSEEGFCFIEVVGKETWREEIP